MNQISLRPTIEKLEILFSKFNERFYDGKLQYPIITVSPDISKGTYGWCTNWKVWKHIDDVSQDDGYYEINLCSDYLSRPFADIAETLLHEMAHLFNLQKSVSDVSRSGGYHNKKFKEVAETHGLVVERHPSYGWCCTRLNDESLEYIVSLGEEEFQLVRMAPLRELRNVNES